VRQKLRCTCVCVPAGDDTPFRGGNYDLLQALATRQATKAALASLRGSSQNAASFEVLHAHWEAQRELFTGDIKMHASESFLHKLLELPVTMRSAGASASSGSSGSGSGAGEAALSVVDPRAICEELLEWRLIVGVAWIERLASLPQELLEVRRKHLLRLTKED
jgi:hypothetical protein